MQGLTEGRIVHFVMPDGEHRPAIIVKVWSKESGLVNVQVFTDSTNDYDRKLETLNPYNVEMKAGLAWRTSIRPDLETTVPGTWHWIEQA